MLHGLSGPQLSSLTNGGSTYPPPQLSPSPVKLTCCSAGGVWHGAHVHRLCILMTAAPLPRGAAWQENLHVLPLTCCMLLGKQLNLSQLCLPSKNENLG